MSLCVLSLWTNQSDSLQTYTNMCCNRGWFGPSSSWYGTRSKWRTDSFTLHQTTAQLNGSGIEIWTRTRNGICVTTTLTHKVDRQMILTGTESIRLAGDVIGSCSLVPSRFWGIVLVRVAISTNGGKDGWQQGQEDIAKKLYGHGETEQARRLVKHLYVACRPFHQNLRTRHWVKRLGEKASQKHFNGWNLQKTDLGAHEYARICW